MIVDPDFLDHWRTRMLVDALGGDEMAPFYVLRIWGHCQQRHGDRFAMPAAGVKALCKATCGAAELEQALIDAGFIAREGSEIVVLKWAEKNASLLAAWENGNKGGRPKKKTQEKPSENPAVTETKPTANPDETQTKPIREEKSREEPTTSLRSVERASKRCPDSFEVTAEMRDWAASEAPGVNVDRETDKFRDYTFSKARNDWPATWRNWIRKAFDDMPKAKAHSPPGETAYQRSMRERVEQFAPGLAAKPPGTQTQTVLTEVFDVTAKRIA